MFLFGCFLVFALFVFHLKKNWKIRRRKKKKNSVFVYIGTYVSWMAIETKFSKFYISCNLDEHLNA